jgi:hypothetical protein
MDRIIRVRRSGTVSKRITPSQLEQGELFLNYNTNDPGLFFKDNNSPTPKLRKVGAAHVGALPPNSNPPEGFVSTVGEGEFWFDTNPSSPTFRNLLIYVGGEWLSSVSFVEQI